MYYRLSSAPTTTSGLSAPKGAGWTRAVSDALRSGKLMLALGMAFALGERDEDKLTNMLFFARHPERKGRALDRSEPGYKQLSREWLDLRRSYVRPFLKKIASGPVPTAVPAAPPASGKRITYKTRAGYYGPVWKRRGISPLLRGLPSWARTASERLAALPHVERLAREKRLGSVFEAAVRQMALTESQATFALPANKFDARPPQLRPPGKRLITAWGVFQFNRDAWTSQFSKAERRRPRRSRVERGEGGCQYAGGCIMPWDTTAHEEIAIPIGRYAAIFREVTSKGGSGISAAQAIRLWHIGSGLYAKWIKKAERAGFVAAQASLSPRLRSRLKKFLAKAGIAS